jgi:hypothetical protein
MRKRTSTRRWKARCMMGREIPLQAIIDHRLERWFVFTPADPCREFYLARPKHG